jgi:hypothetical protein
MSALGRGRADIVVAGALAVRCWPHRFRSRSLLCSTQGYGTVWRGSPFGSVAAESKVRR